MSTVVGDAATIVGEWTADARVRALSFTGSTEVGKLLYRQSADTVKRLVLELGGHAPFIVFDDADLDRAVTEAVKAKFATSGQDCLGANRIYVQREVYAEFCARFTQAVQALTMGSGQNDPDIGPLINEKAIQKQVEQVTDALANGAKVLTGGAVDESLGPLFFQPTVLADVPDTAAIMSQENFGPVAPITAFDTEEEVIQRANATEYGLVAYVHSLDPRRIYRLTRALQFGMVAVNRTKVTGAPIPFGGVKQSGLGREGARQGLEAFTDIKYVCRDWG
jgi:aspartate-semialdehyde dehydrogenase